jgi:hypothetical protein
MGLLIFQGLSSPALSDGGDLLWRAPGIENVVCMEWIEDIDGDDLPDVIFETYDAGAPQTDHLIAIRGASSGVGDVIWSIRPPGGPSNSGSYGDNCLRISPDLDGDGVSDVLLGTAWGGRTAYAVSGIDGDILWSFDTYGDSPPTPPASGWVYGIDWIGDFTGDGVPEVIFCTGSDNNGMYCADGSTGAIQWFMEGPDAFFDCRNVGDVNGDGFDDAAFGAGDNGDMLFVMSGPGDGAGNPDVIWQLPYGDSVFSIAPMASMNGDMVPEIVAGAWDNTVKCHEGGTGGILWTAPIGFPVMRIAVGGDVNDDGVPDIAVASWASSAKMVSGLTGTILWSTPLGDDVWAIDVVDDVTGDGVGDVVAGSFNKKIYLLDGTDGSVEWFYTTNAKLFTVRGTPDLDGNGTPDVIGGTQELSGVGGDTYALQGGEISSSVEETGYAFRLTGQRGSRIRGPVALAMNRPNPFGRPTRWGIELARDAIPLTVDIVDARGRRIRRIETPEWDRGLHAVVWDTRDDAGAPTPSGVYFLRLSWPRASLTSERAVLLR